MGKLQFSEDAWADFSYWLNGDSKTIRKIMRLLEDIKRNGYQGIGKPEPLTGDLSGYWSRRIDYKNRIVYKMNGDIA
ncbi:MAG: Txe/YoeB family addiction module toxin [Selenomonadaceae bacterium]|nr:Txe/YoeB family addiction module toxin [Selenomonadaceae bacterium]